MPSCASLPYIIRFKQCIFEYLESDRKTQRHLLNACKYASAFPVIMLSATQKIAAKRIDEFGDLPDTWWIGDRGLFRLWSVTYRCMLDKWQQPDLSHHLGCFLSSSIPHTPSFGTYPWIGILYLWLLPPMTLPAKLMVSSVIHHVDQRRPFQRHYLERSRWSYHLFSLLQYINLLYFAFDGTSIFHIAFYMSALCWLTSFSVQLGVWS